MSGSSSTTEPSQRWRIDLEYDGRDFAGWQLQPGTATIQGAIEDALTHLLGQSVRVAGAGRTDAGVHAAKQVASFVTTVERPPERMRGGLNRFLPSSIACLSAQPVPLTFDPRRDPHVKTYRYTWLVRPSRSPLREGRVWHERRPLEVSTMHTAVQAIVGTHDFTSFRAVGCSAKHPIRTVPEACVEAVGDEVRLEVRGTGFLRHMVRILAGTLHEVGRGKRTLDEFVAVLEGKDRTQAGPTAPASGLLLADITYDE
ncbi:MAG: tRNA pseudouridine(38-40) synthase TruA [Myxococcota bacterium]